MASKRKILEAMTRSGLLDIAKHYEITGLTAQSKANIVDALAGSRKVQPDEFLTLFSRDDLKGLCQALSLDESGREKQLLIDRLMGLETGNSDTQTTANNTRQAMAKKKPKTDVDGLNVEDYRHSGAKRKNNPPAKIAAEGMVPVMPKIEYSYSPRRPPVLRFDTSGKADKLPELLEKATKGPLTKDEAQVLAEALRTQQPWLEWAGKQEAESKGNLEHPGIVPVYGLGCHTDGRPYYAMRFIKGDNLKEAIRQYHDRSAPARDRPLLLRQLRARFVAVCNAIAYAHSRGAIHRDLKPGNIMLGKYGETLVVDWGLAKVVGRSDEPPPGDTTESTLHVRLAGNSDTLGTQLGQAMGTPAYMSPEQAAGRGDVGPASDIYSLGATLYHLLVGRPAFQEADINVLLAKVREGDFPPPRKLHRDVPRPLESICLKAMATRPEDRYTSALALAADIEHWLGDEAVSAHRETVLARAGRWLRRHRARAASAAIILVVCAVALSVSTILIGLEQLETEKARKRAEHNFLEARKQGARAETNLQAAEKQRRRAETNFKEAQSERQRAEEQAAAARAQKKLADASAARALLLKNLAEQHGEQARLNFQKARDAVDQMLAETDKSLPRGADMQPIRRKILEKALTFYQGFRKEKSDDPEVRQNAGQAHARLADIYQRLGEEKLAHDNYVRAISLFQGLLEKSTDAQVRKDLARCHNNLGTLFSRQDKEKDAIQEYERSLAVMEKLVRDFPEEPDLQAELANTIINLGNRLAALGKASEARVQHDRAFEIISGLTQRNPHRLDYQHDLAGLHITQGQALERARKSQAAHDAFRSAHAVLVRLLKARPGDPDLRRDLATAHYGMGIQLANLKKGQQAYDEYQKALAIRQKLTDEFPRDFVYQTDLANSHHILGLRLSRMDRPADAEKSYRTALALRQKLVAEFPKRPLHQRQLAETLVELGALLERQGLNTAARESYRQALATLLTSKGHAVLARAAASLPRLMPSSWQDHLEAACCFARCADFTKTDDRLSAERKAGLARAYADQAIRFLQQAVDNGLTNPLLLDDPRLQSLRTRSDFGMIVTRLKNKL
ncbi:MAG: tetratricopeptide repeat protein [Planctomycetes bacterium]|nr:tetratricopeptide repeat protein [Planctomycetota bacterium]